MDRVLPGEHLPWTFSLTDTGIFQSSYKIVNGDDFRTFCDVRIREFQKGICWASGRRHTEPPPGWTFDIDCHNVLKIRRADNRKTLSRTNEGERREI